MRKESLKKNSTNGLVEDATVENDADINGGVAIDADPLVSFVIIMLVTIYQPFKFVARR